MRVPLEEIERIATLARLAVTGEERKALGMQLGGILEYVKKLDELDTSDVPPTYHVLELTSVSREDAVRHSLPVDLALANAPDTADGFYRVPKIIE